MGHLLSSCQVQQCAEWLIDRYDMKLPGKRMLPPFQEAAVMSCMCRCVYGYGAVQRGLAMLVYKSPWSKPLPAALLLLPAAWPCPGTRAWRCGVRLSVSRDWRSMPVPWEWGLCKRSSLEVFQALQGFCSLHSQGTFLCELEVPSVRSSLGPASYSALNPLKSLLWVYFRDNLVTMHYYLLPLGHCGQWMKVPGILLECWFYTYWSTRALLLSWDGLPSWEVLESCHWRCTSCAGCVLEL